jgi:hypothetical protein
MRRFLNIGGGETRRFARKRPFARKSRLTTDIRRSLGSTTRRADRCPQRHCPSRSFAAILNIHGCNAPYRNIILIAGAD